MIKGYEGCKDDLYIPNEQERVGEKFFLLPSEALYLLNRAIQNKTSLNEADWAALREIADGDENERLIDFNNLSRQLENL